MKKLILFFVMLVDFASTYAREPQRGYRGFIEWDNSFGKGDWFSSADGEDKHDDLLFRQRVAWNEIFLNKNIGRVPPTTMPRRMKRHVNPLLAKRKK